MQEQQQQPRYAPALPSRPSVSFSYAADPGANSSQLPPLLDAESVTRSSSVSSVASEVEVLALHSFSAPASPVPAYALRVQPPSSPEAITDDTAIGKYPGWEKLNAAHYWQLVFEPWRLQLMSSRSPPSHLDEAEQEEWQRLYLELGYRQFRMACRRLHAYPMPHEVTEDWTLTAPTFVGGVTSAVLLYSFIALLLPVNLLLISCNCEYSKAVRQYCQQAAWDVLGVSRPLSWFKLSWWKVLIASACMAVVWGLLYSLWLWRWLLHSDGRISEFPQNVGADVFYPMATLTLISLILAVQLATTLDLSSNDALLQPQAQHDTWYGTMALQSSIRELFRGEKEQGREGSMTGLVLKLERESSAAVRNIRSTKATRGIRSNAATRDRTCCAAIRNISSETWFFLRRVFVGAVTALIPNFVMLYFGLPFVGTPQKGNMPDLLYSSYVIRIVLTFFTTFRLVRLLQHNSAYFAARWSLLKDMLGVLRRDIDSCRSTARVLQRDGQQDVPAAAKKDPTQLEELVFLLGCWLRVHQFLFISEKRAMVRVQISLGFFLAALIAIWACSLAAITKDWDGWDEWIIIYLSIWLLVVEGFAIVRMVLPGTHINSNADDVLVTLRTTELQLKLLQAEALTQRLTSPVAAAPRHKREELRRARALDVLAAGIAYMRDQVSAAPLTIFWIPITNASLWSLAAAIIAALASLFWTWIQTDLLDH